MNPESRLFFKLLNLPIAKRWEIALQLGLVADGESIDSDGGDSAAVLFIVRARNNGKIDKLRELIMEPIKPMTAKDLQDQFREETGESWFDGYSANPDYVIWLEKKYLEDHQKNECN